MPASIAFRSIRTVGVPCAPMEVVTMPKRQNGDGKKLDLDGELGVSRRDLLRRGAVVGGTLLWVAPAIQSLSPAASAQAQGPTPGRCAACYCWTGREDKSRIRADECSDDGPVGIRESAEACAAYCDGQGYEFSEYCSGTTSCVCSTRNDGLTLNGVTCT